MREVESECVVLGTKFAVLVRTERRLPRLESQPEGAGSATRAPEEGRAKAMAVEVDRSYLALVDAVSVRQLYLEALVESDLLHEIDELFPAEKVVEFPAASKVLMAWGLDEVVLVLAWSRLCPRW